MLKIWATLICILVTLTCVSIWAALTDFHYIQHLLKLWKFVGVALLITSIYIGKDKI